MKIKIKNATTNHDCFVVEFIINNKNNTQIIK